MFSSRFLLFPTFLEKHFFLISFRVFYAIGNLYPIYILKKIVVLASEPVGGRSRATELPCFISNVWVVGGGGGGNVFLAFYAIFLILYAKCGVGGGGIVGYCQILLLSISDKNESNCIEKLYLVSDDGMVLGLSW